MNGRMNREEILRQKLTSLKVQHSDLDLAITAIEQSTAPDTLAIRRLKKQKLDLKDQIKRLSDEITPDIIA